MTDTAKVLAEAKDAPVVAPGAAKADATNKKIKPLPHRAAKIRPLPAKPQPTKRLPSERIKFQKQLDIIRAYGIRSDGGSHTANYKDVGQDVDTHPNTVSLLVGFFVENGFLDRIGTETMPTKSVLDFTQAYNWAPDTA
ncbi:MAG TPA: hypothetical protein VN823_21065, partial [Stellaceae bacterium]|nr:hypothetical protein [Stellaceae bacterium]